MLEKVVVIAVPEMAPFEFGVLCEVFGIDRRDDGAPAYDFHVVAADPGRLAFRHGMTLEITEGLEGAEDADLVAVPAYSFWRPADPRVLDAVRRAHARGAWVLSVCSGAFLLAEAGLLDGRPSTTHWKHAEVLQSRFPTTRVDPNVLFVESDRIVTSAGTASGIDAALHIVRTEQGSQIANIIARRMVVPPQRDGGQAQYIAVPVPEVTDQGFGELIDWIEDHLDADLSVDALARRVHMSTRTFARRFRAEAGTTPAAWVATRRLARARLLLEQSDMTVDAIAATVGFGPAAVLRQRFQAALQTSPNAYRRRFTCAVAS